MSAEEKLLNHMNNISYRGSTKPFDLSNNSLNKKHQNLKVSVQIVVHELGRLSETENEFSVSLTLNQKWIDHRLILNQSFEFLSLTYFKSKIWIPDLYFYNMKSYINSPQTPLLIWLYPNGTLVYSTSMHMKLYCHMNLWKFPLDSQVCSMELGSYGYPSEDLKLVWWHKIEKIKENVYLKHIFNTDFHEPTISIDSHDLCPKFNGNFSILIVKFHFTRNFIYHLIYTFLPSTLIVCISWVSFFIDYKAAPARVPFCLLTLLTIMTQWSHINSTLPRLSYLKSIDIWMFICLSFIILSLFEYALVNQMAVKQEQRRLSNQVQAALKTEFQHLSESINLNLANSSVLREDHGIIKHGKNKRQINLKPRDIDKLASYLFPIMFVMASIIFWNVFSFKK